MLVENAARQELTALPTNHVERGNACLGAPTGTAPNETTLTGTAPTPTPADR